MFPRDEVGIGLLLSLDIFRQQNMLDSPAILAKHDHRGTQLGPQPGAYRNFHRGNEQATANACPHRDEQSDGATLDRPAPWIG